MCSRHRGADASCKLPSRLTVALLFSLDEIRAFWLLLLPFPWKEFPAPLEFLPSTFGAFNSESADIEIVVSGL